jgi:3-deoxy-manno-octulosonate cytidylyltransferase (CMP-KDO synthetase)
MNNTPLIVIPCRVDSTRLEKKLFQKIDHRVTLIERCVEQTLQAAVEAFDKDFKLVVAVDDVSAFEPVIGHLKWGLDIVKTSSTHTNGTSRVVEVIEKDEYRTFQNVIVVQGDEVFIDKDTLIDLYLNLIDSNAVTILRENFDTQMGAEPSVVKAMYNPFAREIVSLDREPATTRDGFYEHIGIYAYNAELLKRTNRRPDTALMQERNIELLKLIELGVDVRAIIANKPFLNVNTEKDLKNARQKILEEL